MDSSGPTKEICQASYRILLNERSWLNPVVLGRDDGFRIHPGPLLSHLGGPQCQIDLRVRWFLFPRT